LGEVRGIYSDLLLHDMGQSLSDSGTYYGIDEPDSTGGPSPQEWRTPPLWGFRDSAPYLHDGRAQTLEEAVALHEGQGAGSAHRFFSLPARERFQIEEFLKSLVAPSSEVLPGTVFAAELESRVEKEEWYLAETRVRRLREEAAVREQQRFREEKRRERAEAAVRRATSQLALARSLENRGKVSGALLFYREIAANAPDTEVGRVATSRIASLSGGSGSP
jgi:hypothetical protein